MKSCMRVFAPVSISLVIIVLSCEKTPTGPASRPFFSIFITADDLYWNEPENRVDTANNVLYDVYCYSAPKASALSLALNNASPDMVYQNASDKDWYDCIYSSGTFLHEGFSGAKKIDVSSDLGNASGSIEIPDPTVITSHRNEGVISPDASITLAWNGNADYYNVNVSMFYSDDSYADLYDSITAQNSFTIPVSDITPASSYCIVSVFGVNGSLPVRGSGGNLSGEGQGFIFAENNSGPAANSNILLYFSGRSSAPVNVPLARTRVNGDKLRKKIIETATRSVPKRQ